MTKSDLNRSQNGSKHLKPAILKKIFASRSQSYENSVDRNKGSDVAGSSFISPDRISKKRFVKKANATSVPTAQSPLAAEVRSEQPTTKQKKESQVEKMRDRLNVGQFRYLSEQLYTQTSNKAQSLFTEKPELFHAYHRGYIRQQENWPSNPLDSIISEVEIELKSRITNNDTSSYTVADFGCGDARLARTLKGNANSSQLLTVHSFDFVAANEHVVACDMAHTPLEDSSVDVVIFCLSLMGTNVNEFITEANRVLKDGGRLRIAEVRSRFNTVAKFVKKLKSFGFKLTELRGADAGSFFTHLAFVKVSKVKRLGAEIELAPCIYKKR